MRLRIVVPKVNPEAITVPTGCCAGYLGHPFCKEQLESDLLVPFCLRERSGTI